MLYSDCNLIVWMPLFMYHIHVIRKDGSKLIHSIMRIDLEIILTTCFHSNSLYKSNSMSGRDPVA